MNAKSWFQSTSFHNHTTPVADVERVTTKSGLIVREAGIGMKGQFFMLSPFNLAALTCKHCCRVLYFEKTAEGYRNVCCGYVHHESGPQ